MQFCEIFLCCEVSELCAVHMHGLEGISMSKEIMVLQNHASNLDSYN